MRPIKFRIWNKTKNTYIYSEEFDGEQTLNLYFFFKFIEDMKCCGDKFLNTEQFTGHQDKNGNDIYIYDFFKRPRHDNKIYVVEDLLDFGFNLYEFWMNTDCIEIIGNIHENGDLLC
jgi:hypothetical protein